MNGTLIITSTLAFADTTISTFTTDEESELTQQSADLAASAAAGPTFAKLGLPADLLAALDSLGFTKPTPIQAACVPALLAGQDVVGIAQTGTGKTAAFGLPLLAGIDPDIRQPQALVLAPTRELALQSSAALESFGARMNGLSIVTLYGGAPFYPQKKALDRGAQVVVGTPGRIIDHLHRGSLDLSQAQLVVLDEGDEMLKMGFAEDVDTILGALPDGHQTALFSATLPPAIQATVSKHLHDPQRIEVSRESSTVDGITQRYAVVPAKHKIAALTRILATSEAEAALVFVQTKADCEEVGAALTARGVKASVISGDVAQANREKIINQLRSGQVNVLVATDVAARGLDVDRIGLVVNFSLPRDPEVYVHRIGRTGRAGADGTAFLFVAPRETNRLRRVERITHSAMIETAIPTSAQVSEHALSKLLGRVSERQALGHLKITRQAIMDYLVQAVAASEPGVGTDMTEQAIELATALAALAIGDEGRDLSAVNVGETAGLMSQLGDDSMDRELAALAGGSRAGSRDQSADSARPARSSHSARRPYEDSGRPKKNKKGNPGKAGKTFHSNRDHSEDRAGYRRDRSAEGWQAEDRRGHAEKRYGHGEDRGGYGQSQRRDDRRDDRQGSWQADRRRDDRYEGGRGSAGWSNRRGESERGGQRGEWSARSAQSGAGDRGYGHGQSTGSKARFERDQAQPSRFKRNHRH